MTKRIAYKTARVNWHMGLALQPEHLYAQEASIREELYARAALQAAPAWGIAHVAWNEELLRDGTVMLDQLTVVMPSGIYLDVPGNAAIASLDLTLGGTPVVPVYVHFLGNFLPVPQNADDPWETDDVELMRQELELSTSDQLATAPRRPIKLAEFINDNGTWTLSANYIPPALSVQLPFFDEPIRRTRSLCGEFEHAIREELNANYLAAEAHTANTHGLRALWRMRGVLADMDAGLAPHPFDFFKELRGLYLDICLFRKSEPRLAALPYRHKEIAEDVNALLFDLEAQFDVPVAAPRYHELTLTPEGRRVCELPKGVTRASDVILLVQKPDVSTPFDIGALKFASLDRLQIVHQRSLSGLCFEQLAGPPFYHGLSASVTFFKPKAGAEWDHVVNGGSLAVSNSKKLEGFRLFLYAQPPAAAAL